MKYVLLQMEKREILINLLNEYAGHQPSTQVYIRLFWFYEASQLPAPFRNQPHHASRELLASNAVAVIHANSIAGHAHVSHWREAHKALPPPDPFWGQTYDVQRQQLSVCTLFLSFFSPSILPTFCLLPITSLLPPNNKQRNQITNRKTTKNTKKNTLTLPPLSLQPLPTLCPPPCTPEPRRAINPLPRVWCNPITADNLADSLFDSFQLNIFLFPR